MEATQSLEDCLNDCAVIRVTFETFDLFPDSDRIRAEMQDIVEEAKAGLLRRLQALHDAVLRDAVIRSKVYPKVYPKADFRVDYDTLRRQLIKLMTEGYPGKRLNHLMKINVFDEGDSSLYYFRFSGLVDIEAAQKQPAHLFVALFVRELIGCASNQENYKSGGVFNKEFFQRFLWFLFAYYSATDPMFYH